MNGGTTVAKARFGSVLSVERFLAVPGGCAGWAGKNAHNSDGFQ